MTTTDTDRAKRCRSHADRIELDYNIMRQSPSPDDADLVALLREVASLSAALEEAKRDTERLDWMQQRVAGTGEAMQFGGVCYWSIEIVKGRRSKPVRIGEGDDLRDAVDDAMGATMDAVRAALPSGDAPR